MNADTLTQSSLKELLHYDPETGLFTWKVKRHNKAKIGDVAGCVRKDGYVVIRINNVLYLGQRLAFLYMMGAFPEEGVDHINGRPRDNRYKNLRKATQSMNVKNARRSIKNTTGITGVSANKRYKKYHAYIQTEGRMYFLGYFEDWFDAVCARKSAESKHGFHPNHGRIV